MALYAVIDPNWGEPKVVIETISNSQDGAKALAVMCEEISLYSGASFACVPTRVGDWKKLAQYGFEIGEIDIKIRTIDGIKNET